jgi:RNA polymerase-associated protein RTF1
MHISSSACFLQEEVRKNKGKKVDDPFTRRSTKPRMVFKVHDQENMEDAQMIMTAAEVSNVDSVQAMP